MSAHVSPAAAADSGSGSGDTLTFFFYGTLAHPSILARILGPPGGSHGTRYDAALSVHAPALLKDYAALHVRGADYPALVPASELADVKQADAGAPTVTRGVLVRGLTRAQAALLDAFEGADYSRELGTALVRPESAHPPVPNAQRPTDADGLCAELGLSAGASAAGDGGEEQCFTEERPCHVYAWRGGLSALDAARGTWSLGAFLRERARRWVGPGLTEEAKDGAEAGVAATALAESKAGASAAAQDPAQDEQAHAREEYAAVDAARERLAQAAADEGAGEAQGSIDGEGDDKKDPDVLASFLGAQGRTASSHLASMPVGADPWSTSSPVLGSGGPSGAPNNASGTANGSAAARSTADSAANPWANEEEEQAEREREAAAVRAALAGAAGGAAGGGAVAAATVVGGAGGAGAGSSVGADGTASKPGAAAQADTPVDPALAALSLQPDLSGPTWGSATPPPLPRGPVRGNSSSSAGAGAADSSAPPPLAGDPEFGLEKLGHAAARFWGYAPGGYTNLNSGAFGTCPKPVRQAYMELQELCDSNPDYFGLTLMPKHLERARGRVASMLNVPADHIAFIANATTGTNAVLRDYRWGPGDKVLVFNTLYNAVGRTIQYIRDTVEHPPDVVVLEVRYPLSHDKLIALVRSRLDALKAAGEIESLKIAVFDAITSRPGVRVPWERLCKLFKEYGVLSCVDAAHGIGAIPLNVGEADPDFFVSNCHKWMYAPRSTAVFYVPPRNRHIVRSSMPTSHFYMDAAKITPENNSWLAQWEMPGTNDFAHFPAVNAALDFRERLGGEERIMAYVHRLAREGGAAAAKILGTELLETDDWELTSTMVNVRLPIVPSADRGTGWTGLGKIAEYFDETLQKQFKTTLPLCEHAGKVWARFSAQVFLEVSDFEYGARALLELCRRINEGEVTFA